MRTAALLTMMAIGLSVAPAMATAETWENVSLVDTMCARKVQKEPDTHTKDCAEKCAGSGFGVILADGTFLKLDKAGSEKALAALKATEKKDHLRATVTGERAGDTITVKTIELK